MTARLTPPQASTPRLRLVANTLGPAFVAAIAYVDPGNFATNFAAGIKHGYRLVWVIVLANLIATLVQYVTSKVGLSTGRTLPELCQQRFGRSTNRVLWVQAELVAMATDLAEFVGAAVGLHLLFGLPLLAAGLLTAVVAFLILALDAAGRRRFIGGVVVLLLVVAGGVAYLFATVGQRNAGDFAAGLVPRLGGSGTNALIVAIVGATVMPHVIYAHSALQTHHGEDHPDRKRLLRINGWDCAIGLGTAGLINLAMLCAAAQLPAASGGVPETDLESIHAALHTTVGAGAGLAFAVALTASGFASAGVGTYAGQVVMSGFVRRSLPLVLRRGITMIPALLVLALSVNSGSALVWSQIVLSFGIPFALVPLLLISTDRTVMRDLVNRRATTLLLGLATVVITALNCVLIGQAAL